MIPFAGMYPFIQFAAEKLGFSDLNYIGKAKNLWHTSQLQSSLGSIDHIPLHNQEGKIGVIKHCSHVRQSLHVALKAADDAIADTCERHDLPKPDWMLIDGPTQREDADSDSERNDLESVQDGGDSSDSPQPHRRKRR